MNPFALLLGLISIGSGIGSGKPKLVKSHKHTDEDPINSSYSTEHPKAPPPPDEPDEPNLPNDPVIAIDPIPEIPEQPEDPAPEVPEQPEDPPVVINPNPDAPDQSGDGGSGAETPPTVIADGTTDVMAGRVATLDPAGDVTGLRIVSGVEHGTVTVNPDNTFALVMTQSDFIGSQSFTYEATHADGSTSTHEVDLNVGVGAQQGGWGTGETQYMLETDENDRVIVEAGENHQKIYVTASGDGLSLSDIAALEGISTSQVTADWLSQSSYGNTEETALDQQAGEMLWKSFEGTTHSNWLLLESGYTYDQINPSVFWSSGESEIHPIYVGAWGEGDRPQISDTFRVFNESENVVIQGLHFTNGGETYMSNNLIFDDIEVEGSSLVTHFGSGLTVRNSYVHDISDPSQNYIQGHFANGDGLLMENNIYDHNGWTDSYYENGYGDPADPMSHNLYIDYDSTDVTVRDTISMQSSQTGLIIRSGGFVENNLLLDNNWSIAVYGGDFYDAGHIGNYSLFLDNVITSAGGRQGVNLMLTSEGIHDEALLTSYVDNIIAHMSDPNGNDQGDYLGTNHVLHNPAYYNDTMIWNWFSDQPNAVPDGTNTDGLDPDALNATTIQNFAAQLLDDPNASIGDLADYLRSRADGQLNGSSDVDLINQFFQEGFGISSDIRTSAETLRFVPDDLGDGVRWDNRLNWDTEDLPGLHPTDSVDLGGNHVVYGSNTTIDTLDMGPGGALSAYGGRLTLNGGFTGDDSGDLNIEGAGQVWAEGSDAADLDITVQGGRFANTGLMQNADLTATGGQTILASGGAEFDLGAGHTLALNDSDARMGFDGDDGGMAILDMHADATLAFSADDGDLGEIAEFRSGAYGDNPDVQSGIDLGNATLSIDLTGLSAEAGTAFTLMSADEIVGLFDDATIGGLGARDANIVIDYASDTVTLQLNAGNGAVSIETVGSQDDVTSGYQGLWDALTADQEVLSETLSAAAQDEEELDPLLAA